MRPLLTLLGMQEPAHIKAPSGIVGHVIHLHLPEVDGCGRHRNRKGRNDLADTIQLPLRLAKALVLGAGCKLQGDARGRSRACLELSNVAGGFSFPELWPDSALNHVCEFAAECRTIESC